MKPDLLEALRASVEAVRGQIPAADAGLAEAGAPSREAGGTSRPVGTRPVVGSKRQQAREKWARIARQNATETQRSPGQSE